MTHQFKFDSLASVFADTARGYTNFCTVTVFWSEDVAMNMEGENYVKWVLNLRTVHSQLHGHCDLLIALLSFKLPSWNN